MLDNRGRIRIVRVNQDGMQARKYYRKLVTDSPFHKVLAVTMVMNILLAILSLLSGTIAARLLGPTGRGELAAIQTFPMMLALLASLGVPDALVYYSAREPVRAKSWLASAICLAIIGSIPFALLGYFFLPYVLKAQSASVISAAQVYLWWLPISAVFGFLIHPLRGRNDLLVWNLLRPIPNIAWIATLLAHGFSGTPDPISLSRDFLLWYTIAGLATAICIAIRLPGSFHPSLEQVSPLLRFGLPNMIGTLPSLINLRLDQLVLASLLSPKVLGLYVASVAWSGAVIPLVNAVAAVLLPRAAGAGAEKRSELIAQSTRIGFILSIMLSLLSAALTPFVVPLLFGEAFSPAILAAVILCLAGGFSAFNQVLTAAIQSTAKPHYIVIAESSGLIVTVVLLWILLPVLQLTGAALTSLISYFVVAVIQMILIGKETRVAMLQLLLPSIAEISRLIARAKL